MKVIREHLPLPGFEGNERFTLQNENGFSVSLMSFGATLLTISAADRAGNYQNILCCYENLSDFVTAEGYLNATVGPVAGRIAGASFQINGKDYTLEKNNKGNTLHSAGGGVSHLLWQTEEIFSDDHTAWVCLSIRLANQLGGFPGNRRIFAEFSIVDTTLTICYMLETDEETPANLTNHAYIDLSGRFDGSALRQKLQINAERVLLNDEENLPTRFANVTDTPYDLRKSLPIAAAAQRPGDVERLQRQRGFDNAYDLAGSPIPQIILSDAESGRTLEVSTDQHAVVLYAGGFMDSLPAFMGDLIPVQGAGICLETQDYPNAFALGLPLQTATPQTPCVQKTTYRFTVT